MDVESKVPSAENTVLSESLSFKPGVSQNNNSIVRFSLRPGYLLF